MECIRGINYDMKRLFTFASAIFAIVLLAGCNKSNESVEPVDDDIHAGKCIDLGLSVMWATYNVGATKPEEYGDYFAWAVVKPYYAEGHAQDNPCSEWIDGKTCYTIENYPWADLTIDRVNGITKYTYADGWKDGIWYDGDAFIGDKGDGVEHKTLKDYDYEDDVARVTWGGTWRIPTAEEIDELIDECSWDWTKDYNGTRVSGMIVTSKKEGYTDRSIFLPAAGFRREADLRYAGGNGYYWSSTVGSDNSTGACAMPFYKDYVKRVIGTRPFGYSVRPVKNR